MKNENKVSEAQRKATKNWETKNREHSNYLKNRSAAKSFILKKAHEEDLKLVEEWLDERKKNNI
ncbi:hypothetical protein [Pseudolactococcus insecticola]|nr:hypothetical protein [Lactococcus insecticola]